MEHSFNIIWPNVLTFFSLMFLVVSLTFSVKKRKKKDTVVYKWGGIYDFLPLLQLYKWYMLSYINLFLVNTVRSKTAKIEKISPNCSFLFKCRLQKEGKTWGGKSYLLTIWRLQYYWVSTRHISLIGLLPTCYYVRLP